jgi:hypothetical protein
MKNKPLLFLLAIAHVLFFTGCDFIGETTKVESTIDVAQRPNTPFIDINDITKCVVQIECRTTDGKGSNGQGVMYAQVGDKLYIATSKHCLPEGREKIMKIRTSAGKEVYYTDAVMMAYNILDAGMIELTIPNPEKRFHTVSEYGLIANQTPIGDTVILVTPFDARKATKKYGTLTDNTTVDFSPVYAEPGDSGSPVVCRHGIVGILFGLRPENVNEAVYVEMSYFEKIYLEFTQTKS